MNGINPKTNWNPGDGIKADDLNHIEGLSWELVYGCFDLMGSIYLNLKWATSDGGGGWNISSENENDVYRFARKIIKVPPNTKLKLTHLGKSNNFTRATFIANGNRNIQNLHEEWGVESAPTLYNNNTAQSVDVEIALEGVPHATWYGVNGVGNVFHGILSAYARVIITPNA